MLCLEFFFLLAEMMVDLFDEWPKMRNGIHENISFCLDEFNKLKRIHADRKTVKRCFNVLIVKIEKTNVIKLIDVKEKRNQPILTNFFSDNAF